MEYLSKNGFVTKKEIDLFYIKTLRAHELITDISTKNLNPSFMAITQMGNSYREYSKSVDEFGIEYIQMRTNNSRGYPTPISIRTLPNVRYKTSLWINSTESIEDIVIKFREGTTTLAEIKVSSKFDDVWNDFNFELDSFQKEKGIIWKKVEMEFVAKKQASYNLFFEGENFEKLIFTKWQISRAL